MADPQQNPFSSYSLDEQNQYADQLRTAQASGKLNPAQMQGVQSALKYLPMSKSAADANLTNLATGGMGKWQPSTPSGPSFAQSHFVDPQAPEVGGHIAAADTISMPFKNGQFVPTFTPTKTEMVESRQVSRVRDQLQQGSFEPADPLGTFSQDPISAFSYLKEAHDTAVAGASAFVGDKAASLIPKSMPRTRGVARGVGGFAGGLIDPLTVATAGAGKLATAGFALQGAYGTYKGAEQYLNSSGLSPEENATALTETALSGLMTGIMGKHAVKGAMKPSYRPPSPDLSAHEGIIDREAAQIQAGKLTSSPDRLSLNIKPDNDAFAQAKSEWQTANPGKDPTSAISQIALRAQQLKTEAVKTPAPKGEDDVEHATRTVGNSREPIVATPDKATSASREEFLNAAKARTETPQPDTGSKWKSVQQQLDAGETPKSAGSPPLQRPPRQVEPAIDLRSMTSEARHDWVNKNAPVALGGFTPEQALANAKQIFGDRDFKIASYLDNAGRQKFGTTYPTSENKTSLPSQSETAGAKESTPPTETSGTPSNSGNPETQALEEKVLKSGAGQQLLDTLRQSAKNSAPEGTPQESIQKVYHRSLETLSRGIETNDAKLMRKSFDIANRRGEAGRFTPAGRPAMTPAQSKVFEEFHVTKMLDKWETFSDEQLKSQAVRKKLTGDEFANSVAATSNPTLEMRHNALLERIGHIGLDPIAALGRLFGGQQLSPGDLSRGVMREALATAARSKDMNAHALETYIRGWNSRPIQDTLSFIDAVETGNISTIPDPQDRMVAQRLRDMLDSKRDQINGLGTGKFDTFIDNYFPHLWKFGLGDTARSMLQGRRPLSGGAGFLKPRTYDSFVDGIAAGLEPVTYNPIQMALLKLHEMDRYLAAHTAFEELKSKGLAAPFEAKDVPEGWAKLNDQMFRAGKESYYAPADAARPINNHLSPGLRGNTLFNSVSAYNNIFNQANLGLSVFHGTETAINSIASDMGLGLQKISRGNLRGVANLVSATTGPVHLLRNYLLANRLIAEYLEPGRYAQLSHLVTALEQAGGRIAMPPEYRNAAREGLRNAWKEQIEAKGFANLPAAGKLLYRSLGAALETTSIPIMEKFVPRMKLAAFAREAQDVIDRLGPIAPKEVTRAELGKVWDSVDNRFGQVVYDNLFWNRTVKDLAHLAIRSVGWNFGTIREVGGGVLNVRAIKQPLTGKGLTTKQAYILALGVMVAGTGAVINGIYGQKPESLDDYLYPKTDKIGPDGQRERIMMKTYMHDTRAFQQDPLRTGLNKMAPVWNQMFSLATNSDYYGTRIHPIHASTKDALLDPKTYTSTAAYLGKSALPFSVENYKQRRASGESILASLGAGAAILPAPKWAGQTPAAAMAYEFYKTKLARGPNDPDVVARLQRYHQLATGYAANQFTVADITKAYKNKEITTKQFDGILDEADGKMTPLQRHSKQLSPQELLQVWHLSSPEERQSLQEMFLHKWDSTGEDQDLSKKFNDAWKEARPR